MKCRDVQKIDKINNLPLYIIELKFYQDQIKWNHKLIHIEISEIESGTVVALII